MSAEMSCPKCGGNVWDNRETKRNPKMPDYKCRDKACDGVIWPPRDGTKKAPVATKAPPQGRDMGPNVPGLDDASYADSLANDTPYSQVQGQVSPPVNDAVMRMQVCYGHALRIVKEASALGQVIFTGEDIRATAITLFIQGAGR